MRLKDEIINELRESPAIRYGLALKNECLAITVDRWVNNNAHGSPLIQYDNLLFIGEKLNKKLSDLTEDEAPFIPKNINR